MKETKRQKQLRLLNKLLNELQLFPEGRDRSIGWVEHQLRKLETRDGYMLNSQCMIIANDLWSAGASNKI